MEDILDRFENELPAPTRYAPAPKGKRLANFLLDLLGYFLFSFGIGIILYVLATLTGQEQAFLAWAEKEDSPGDLVFGLVMIVSYYALTEYWLHGKTPAKYLTKTRAISLEHDHLSLSEALSRSVSRLVPFEPFSFLGTGPGWHDKWTGTRVVDETKPLDPA